MSSSSKIQEIEKELENSYKIQREIRRNKFLGIDKVTQQPILIILIDNLFESDCETTRLLQEIEVCSEISHKNFLKLYNLKSIQHDQKETLIIVSEALESDLWQVIQSNVELIEDHRRFFIYQILLSLKYLHSANVVHKNLNSSNIMVNSNCDIKIQTVDTWNVGEHVSCRWYRAPEVLLGQYITSSADVWSVGCILYELIMRSPLFFGNSTIDQLQKIISKIGSPTDDDLFYLTDGDVKNHIKSLKNVDQIDWRSKLVPKASKNEFDLLNAMLVWNPTKRISVEESLKHDYFKDLYDPSDESCCPEINIPKVGQFTDESEFRKYFWNEIQRIRENKKFK